MSGFGYSPIDNAVSVIAKNATTVGGSEQAGKYVQTNEDGILDTTLVKDIHGNAETATKLAVSRTISINGAVEGSGSFDGGGNVEIITTPAGVTSLIDGLATQEAVDELKGRAHVPKRQTVLQGKMNYSANGAAFIDLVTGQLKLNLLATEVPLICTIADGFDILYGQKDYIFGFNQDVIEAWALPANKSFLQLYIEYDPTTKTASFGYTEHKTQYSNPSSPVVGQHWFDKDNLFIMQQWNGTAWDKKLRLFVGEATTDASSVTSVTCYAIQGSSVVISNVLAADQVQTLSHNLGRKPNKLGISLLCIWGLALGTRCLLFRTMLTKRVRGVGSLLLIQVI